MAVHIQIYNSGRPYGPAAGGEPSGYDYMYQDVEIPSGSHLSLQFSYNIQTYDTAAWDWFDVYIVDSANNTILATVVSQDGKPGYDYGTYWNGGIKRVTFSL